MWKVLATTITAICLMIAGCDERVVVLYPAQEGRNFADSNFVEMRYRDVEFDLARSQAWGDSGAFMGTFEEWTDLSWGEMIHYLPNQGFTHELPTYENRSTDDEIAVQFYEMIGYYLNQFGFGWDDAFGDDPGTPFFDGTSPRAEYYVDTWLRGR